MAKKEVFEWLRTGHKTIELRKGKEIEILCRNLEEARSNKQFSLAGSKTTETHFALAPAEEVIINSSTAKLITPKTENNPQPS